MNMLEPMRFRRILSEPEVQALRARLSERWQIGEPHWFPLGARPSVDVEAFQERHFSKAWPSQRLTQLLQSRGISRVWELREDGPCYEQDANPFNPFYNFAEGYWSSGDLDWIFYASHESSITIGGWMLQEVKAQWQEWQRYLWDSPSC